MRLSFYTYSYTDRLKLPTVDCLERIAKIGYGGIDVSGTFGNSDDPKSFDAVLRKLTRETAKKLGLRIEAVITHAQLTDSLISEKGTPLDLKGSIDLAVNLGSPVVTFHMGGFPKQAETEAARKEFWNRTANYIREAADYGAARHVSIATDGIWPTWIVDTPDSLARLFDDVGHANFGVNFDPCYLVLMGIEPAKFASRFPKRIVHAHLKDHQGKDEKWTHLIPGRGEMKYAPVFEALAKIGFTGAAAVECFTDMKFEEACDDGFKAMTAAAREAKVIFEKS